MAGLLYFVQMKNQYLISEDYALFQYVKEIKMHNDLAFYEDEYSYKIEKKDFEDFTLENFIHTKTEFIKYIPAGRRGSYFKLTKSTENFNEKVQALRYKIYAAQFFLLMLFALISYILAKNAIKPLTESITKLDMFTKDLIHDLNTPVTAMMLNMRLLQKDPCFSTNQALKRVNRGVHTISELHENLTVLLQEETFQVENREVFDSVNEVVAMHKPLYPNIHFRLDHFTLVSKTNPKALKQILQNMISNACKYNKKGGFVKIYAKGNSLYIQDSGKGIENPEKIFDRSFSGENSSGIGLDIVRRIAFALNIKVEVHANDSGTTFILTFS